MGRLLFVLDKEILETLTMAEVSATANGLLEAGLFRLPAPSFDLKFRLDTAWIQAAPSVPGPWWIVVQDIRDAGLAQDGFPMFGYRTVTVHVPDGQKRDHSDSSLVTLFVKSLVCLLASRNVVKETCERKLVRYGIGKRNPYSTIINLKVPQLTIYDRDGVPTGRTNRAHFRRGFIRRQHFGERNEQEKKVWIAPVFVNADEDFVAPDRTYRLVA